MAYGLQMKSRNPIGVWLGLPLITLGIYHLVWYCKIHAEMAQLDRRRVAPVAGPMLVRLSAVPMDMMCLVGKGLPGGW